MTVTAMEEQRKTRDQTRLEQDYIGQTAVPAQAYYGVHALRARENFPMTGRPLHSAFIVSLAQVKKACALANREAGQLSAPIAEAIAAACDRVIRGELRDQFIVDPIQGGAGTSMNMNMNEVLANAAIEALGGRLGDYTLVHPNDHVNRGQSTNDVIPTAGKLTALRLMEGLLDSLAALRDAFSEKAVAFDHVLKMGRTQLQDAVPVRLGQEFAAYAAAVERGRDRIADSRRELYRVNLGGTAIGTGLNAQIAYFSHVTDVLAQVTGLPFRQAENLLDATQHIDGFAQVSSTVKNAALALSKVANDLRLLSSGPRTGLHEINLPPRQNGSSIMPGKVNPVIPEVVNQAAFRIAGNDVTIAMAVEAGQLELNAFEPVVFDALFESLDLLRRAADTLRTHCVAGITANEDVCRSMVEKSVGVAAALCPHVGYVLAAEMAREALRTGRPLTEIARERSGLTGAQLDEILNPCAMTEPGVREEK